MSTQDNACPRRGHHHKNVGNCRLIGALDRPRRTATPETATAAWKRPSLCVVLVPEGGFEPPRPYRALGPEPSASANSATLAQSTPYRYSPPGALQADRACFFAPRPDQPGCAVSPGALPARRAGAGARPPCATASKGRLAPRPQRAGRTARHKRASRHARARCALARLHQEKGATKAAETARRGLLFLLAVLWLWLCRRTRRIAAARPGCRSCATPTRWASECSTMGV